MPPVLVVDDDPAGRYALARTLQAGGFTTVESAGGAEALEAAARGVSAVVLDVHLPDLSGFEVCRLIRSNPATAPVPVIHISAVHTSAADHIEGLRQGADAYFVTPVEQEILVATLRRLIESGSIIGAAHASESRYRGIFAQAHCGLALVDHHGRILDANPALARLLQQPGDHLVGRTLGSMAPREWKARVERAVAAWNEPPWRGQFPLLCGQAHRVELSWSVTAHLEPGLFVAVVTEPPAGGASHRRA